jgi:hypothetical protein
MRLCLNLLAPALLLPIASLGGAPATAAPLRRAVRPVLQQPTVDRAEVFPAEVVLDSRRSARQLIVTGFRGAETFDLTRQALYQTGVDGIVRVSGGKIVPLADGRTTVTLSAGGRMLKVPVTVSNFSKPDPVRFKFETLPVLTKQGCASGSCHGSPHGKGGFTLSLFGYDPRVDQISLTRDGFNRRINVLEPAESLILKKPLLEVPHVGGKRLRKTDAAYRVLHDWVYAGAATELPATECERIEIRPGRSRVLHAPHLEQQLSVLAYFSDGTTRDVTAISTFESSHPGVVTVDADGYVKGHGRGQAAVSIRYLDRLESFYVTVVEDVPGFVWKAPKEHNWIDARVNEKLRQLQYLPAATCSDEVFVRRVSLDLTGLLPSPERVRKFLTAARAGDTAARSALIDELLETEEYARFWALKKADLMRVSPKRLKDGNAEGYADWIVESIRKNVPYDRFARELLTSSGAAKDVAPANYFLAIPTTDERTEMTAQLFMGSRLECAKCHNHPFEAWTMRDYYSISAVFARTQADKGTVRLTATGEVQHPTTLETLRPWGSSAEQARANAPADRRAFFAEWLTKPGNPYFARVEVNRMWAELLGRGIVNPVDDFRSSNPPANVALLDALAKEFEISGFDRKRIIRLICNSQTYQRSTETNRFNESDEALFSHGRVRLLTAEQLKDAIAVATRALPSIPEGYGQRPRYATQRPYPETSSFTAAFGQPQRDTACTCERQTSPTLLQALELLNGGAAYGMVQTGAGKYAALENDALIEELYLAALCRRPSEKERATARAYLVRAAKRDEAVTDLVWTLVNTQEFLFQH